MEKVYRLLDWLGAEQAVDWLQDLTETPVAINELLQLCESGQCSVYADVHNLDSDGLGFDSGTAKGIHLVTNPIQAFGRGVCSPHEIWTRGDTHSQVGALLLFSDLPQGTLAPIFRPEEIQALAEKMNAAINHSTAADIEEMRVQLKEAHEAKKAAWSSTEKYRAELIELREAAEQDRLYRDAVRLRAERAEKRAEELADHLGWMEGEVNLYKDALESSQAEVVELKKTVQREQMAHKCAESLAYGEDNDTSPTSAEITFPYTTKELEAMRAVALKYWANYSPQMRQPTQTEISLDLCELLGLRLTEGNLPRKAAVLATAIKPHQYADT